MQSMICTNRKIIKQMNKQKFTQIQIKKLRNNKISNFVFIIISQEHFPFFILIYYCSTNNYTIELT